MASSIRASLPHGLDRPIPLRVLRIYHSGVVSGWRERERSMRREGVDVTLVSPKRWNEGGSLVALDRMDDDWVVPSRTAGRHPYLFVYNPLPIVRLLLKQRFDVIDVHEEPASVAALELRLLSWLRHRRTPMLFYGAQNLEKRFPLPFRLIERGSLRRAAAVYPCNRQAGEIFVRRGFRGIVRQLDLGVALDNFRPAPVANRPEGANFAIGYSGRLEEHKGAQVVLRTLRRLPDRFRLQAAGDGPYRDHLVALAAELRVTDRVTFLGHQPHAALADFYRSCDALVVPSQTRRNWVEQFGRVVVEAMASGVPLIVSDSGSLPDLVGDAGLVVGEADDEAWATTLTALDADPALRHRLREAGLERAERFEWSQVAAQHAALYREVTA